MVIVQPYMLVIDFEKLVSNMMFPDLRPRQGKLDDNGFNLLAGVIACYTLFFVCAFTDEIRQR